MVALLLAVALAPTGAGLGAATVLNPVVPVRVRRALNVESGLNDGLVSPVVLFAIAAAAGEEGLRTGITVLKGVVDLLLGVILHDLTADVFAERYSAWIDRVHPPAETAPATEPRARRSLVPWHQSRS